MKLAVQDCWQEYFKYPNEGLGTTYERFILHRYFYRMRERFNIRSVLEVPSFGMTGISGINSMWWATHGVPVTIVDDNRKRLECISEVWNKMHLESKQIYTEEYTSLPFGDQSFDLVWNFASLWFVRDFPTFIKEITRIARKAIFICVPNRSGLGYLARRILGKKTSGEIFEENIIPSRIIHTMHRLNWELEEQGFLDIPPWPDIAMKKEDLLKLIGMGKMADRLDKSEDSEICILDYFSGKNKDLKKEILKYDFLENLPSFFNFFWAHHRYFLFTPA